MSKLGMIAPESATGSAKTLLDSVKTKLGMTPNMMRTMAVSPSVLEGYLNFAGALSGGALDAKLRERIALAVAEANGCNYCLAAHSLLGKGAGLSTAEMVAARKGGSSDTRIAEAVGFAAELVRSRGAVDEGAVARLKSVGYTDGEVAEIVANVALNVFTNYFNLVADTVIDFPQAAPLTAAA